MNEKKTNIRRILEKAQAREDETEKIEFIKSQIINIQPEKGQTFSISKKVGDKVKSMSVTLRKSPTPNWDLIQQSTDEILFNRIISMAKKKTGYEGIDFIIDCIDLYERHDEATKDEFIKLNVSPLRFYNGEEFTEKLIAALTELKTATAAAAAAEIEAEKREGLKWNGKGTQLALFIIIMIDKGYLDPPKSPNGEINYSQLAQIVKQTFVVKDKLTTMIKELSAATNTILKREDKPDIYYIFPDIREM